MGEEMLMVGKEKAGAASIAARDEGDNGSLKNETQNKNQVNGGGEGTTSKKAKSCKGCLYYSSTLKSNSSNPLCVGIPRSLPQVPHHIIGESELEASKEGRNLTDFKYGCVGYSVYSDRKDQSCDVQETQTDLPVCVGIEVIVDRRVTTADSVPAHVHSKEDSHKSPQPRTPRPAQSVGDEFLKRFTRNAGIVATGVAKNLRKVGNHVKDSVDDILFRRRQK